MVSGSGKDHVNKCSITITHGAVTHAFVEADTLSDVSSMSSIVEGLKFLRGKSQSILSKLIESEKDLSTTSNEDGMDKLEEDDDEEDEIPPKKIKM